MGDVIEKGKQAVAEAWRAVRAALGG